MAYAERCSNCKHKEVDEDWSTNVCMCEKSDHYMDWVDDSNNCEYWEEGAA